MKRVARKLPSVLKHMGELKAPHEQSKGPTPLLRFFGGPIVKSASRDAQWVGRAVIARAARKSAKEGLRARQARVPGQPNK